MSPTKRQSLFMELGFRQLYRIRQLGLPLAWNWWNAFAS
ncbi:hypothetical protein M0804_015038 [Polistes exclamans]|nr:hypothetical protein M0804_015039 [Polistes exclamans]KAI4474045.1 hypothetical protein M0804_015038 [Polistes exclamans]